MSNDDSVAIEAVAKAIHDASGSHIPDMGAWTTEARRYPPYGDRVRAEATAAITAYNAYLRERAQDADVVEAVEHAGINIGWGENRLHNGKAALTAALDAMIGKEGPDER